VARVSNRRRVDRVPGEGRRWLRRAASFALVPLLALAVSGSAALLAWRHGFAGDLLRIRDIRFDGLSRARADELLELSPIRIGAHLLLCDTALLEAALRRHPWIASVDVRRSLPPALEVTVVERRAAALVDLGGLYLLDAGGEVFKRAVPGDGLDLPVVTGITRDAWVERRAEVEPLLGAALVLLARWSEQGLDRRAPVSEIHLDPDYGTTLWAGPHGLEVRLGIGDLAEKFVRLERVLSALEAEGQRAEVLHLDNRRRPDWVAVRLAGGGGAGGPVASGVGGNGPRGP